MKADTVELLTTKGRFQAEQALAVAEAIDMAIRDAQLVTVPILDARLVALEVKFEAKMDKRFAEVDARFVALEAKMDARFTASEARMDQKFDRLRLHLIIAMLIGYAAMGPLGNAMLEAIKGAF